MPCPLSKRGAIETGPHKWRHRLERSLWIAPDHLVEMTEAGSSPRLVFPWGDRPVTRHRRLGDMTQVHEVAPVAELLGRLGMLRRDEDQQDPCSPLPRATSLRGTGISPSPITTASERERVLGRPSSWVVAGSQRETSQPAASMAAARSSTLSGGRTNSRCNRGGCRSST